MTRNFASVTMVLGAIAEQELKRAKFISRRIRIGKMFHPITLVCTTLNVLRADSTCNLFFSLIAFTAFSNKITNNTIKPSATVKAWQIKKFLFTKSSSNNFELNKNVCPTTNYIKTSYKSYKIRRKLFDTFDKYFIYQTKKFYGIRNSPRKLTLIFTYLHKIILLYSNYVRRIEQAIDGLEKVLDLVSALKKNF